ncbi:MAG: transglutaminase-like cysteine peptidase [Hydrogenophilales bacterium]|nr:transglutaminase-like cysteine peptidase [Hydrogenophilales bacterium]
MRLFRRVPHTVLILWLTLLTLFGATPTQGDEPKAISFVFTDIDGRIIRLADLRGQWVLVNFWATWCPLCKVAVPTLNDLNKRPDMAVIGVALDYGPDENLVRNAVQQGGLNYHANIAGGRRRNPDSPHRQVGPVDFFPTSYLYDPNGEIVMFIPGQIRTPKILSFMAEWRGGKATEPVYAMNGSKFAGVLKQRFGKKGSQAYRDWRALVDAQARSPISVKLANVNDFFNRRLQADSDAHIWGREEYWATPAEALGAGRGDSEDFVIAKYFTLLALNVPAEQLRLVYVKPQGGTRASGDPVHMVLAYYASAIEEPTLLDNRVAEVLPASKRADLRPVFSFNSLGVWGDPASAQISGDSNRLAVWEDTLRRARDEGFE